MKIVHQTITLNIIKGKYNVGGINFTAIKTPEKTIIIPIGKSSFDELRNNKEFSKFAINTIKSHLNSIKL